MNCACYIAESKDEHPLRLNPCPEHERWARAIRDYEREQCAVVADDFSVGDRDRNASVQTSTAVEIAARIRARGNT